MVMCWVPNCRHYSERRTCRFFRVPKDPGLRERWITFIRRQDTEPTANSMVCSCHFLNGRRENFPTVFGTPVQREKIVTTLTPKGQKHRFPSQYGGQMSKKSSVPTNFSLDSQVTVLLVEEATSNTLTDESSSSNARLAEVMEARDPLEITGHWQAVDKPKLETESLYEASLSSSTISAIVSLPEEEGLIAETCASDSSSVHNGDHRLASLASSPEDFQQNVQQSDPEMRRYYRQPRYMGDIVDIGGPLSPEIVERNWELARRTIDAQKKKIKMLEQQNRRLKAKVASLQALMKCFKEKNVSECEEITIIVDQD